MKPPRNTIVGNVPSVLWYASLSPEEVVKKEGVICRKWLALLLLSPIKEAMNRQQNKQKHSSAKRTILQVLPELHTGGVERGTVEVASAIVQRGWRALVVSAGGSLVKQLEAAGGEHITIDNMASKNPFHIARNAEHIAKIIRDEDVDIVHARSRAPAWSAKMAAERTNRRFITTFHGVYGLDFPLKKLYNSVMTKGERVIAVSNFVSEHIKEHYHMEASRLQVIHRGADVSRFGSDKVLAQRIAIMAKEWVLPDDDAPIILLPGRITRWKGQDIVIKALAELKRKKFLCLLVGDGAKHPDYSNELKEMIKSSGLEGRVRLVGNTPYMNEAYAMSRVVVCPSIEPEAFGRVPVEAQACGKPVIATRHGGACETVIEGDTGWLVTPSDVEEMRAALLKALALNDNEYERMAENGIWNATENFSTHAMCEKVIALYEDVLKTPSSHLGEAA